MTSLRPLLCLHDRRRIPTTTRLLPPNDVETSSNIEANAGIAGSGMTRALMHAKWHLGGKRAQTGLAWLSALYPCIIQLEALRRLKDAKTNKGQARKHARKSGRHGLQNIDRALFGQSMNTKYAQDRAGD